MYDLKQGKPILFIDFNWVISYKNFWFSLEIKDKPIYEKINNFLFKDNIQIVKDWMLWKYDSAEICKFLSDELNINYEYVYKNFICDCENIDLSESIWKLLKNLKKSYNIILVTDNMDSFTEFTVKSNIKYFSIFDSIFNSADAWYFKVDSYSDYIMQYNSEIKSCYLIDDSENNCKNFGSLWWKFMCVSWEKVVRSCLESLLKNIGE